MEQRMTPQERGVVIDLDRELLIRSRTQSELRENICKRNLKNAMDARRRREMVAAIAHIASVIAMLACLFMAIKLAGI